MGPGRRCVASLMFAWAVVCCGADPPPMAETPALVTCSRVKTLFPSLAPALGRALPMKRSGAAYRPVVSAPTGTATRGAWRLPGQHRLSAELPSRATAPIRFSSGPVTLEVTLQGATDVPARLIDTGLVYRSVFPSADSIHLTEAQRVEELFLLKDRRAPRSFCYRLQVTRGGGRARALAGTVEVLDSRGTAWLRFERPYVLDRRGRRHAVIQQLEGERLTLTLPGQLKHYPLLLGPAWTTTGNMPLGQMQMSATLLPNGKVLIAGGCGDPFCTPPTNKAAIYDPISRTWTTTSSMKTGRFYHTATLLKTGANKGRVLVVGGSVYQAPTAQVELYDPAKGTWTAGTALSKARTWHSATLLLSGKVLVAGGSDGTTQKSALLYDPQKGTWSVADSMLTARNRHTATRLIGGQVLVVGGVNKTAGGSAGLSTAEVYNPASGHWTSTDSVVTGRSRHSATLLTTGAGAGKVLLVGGYGKGIYLSSAELYQPKTGKWSSAGSMKAVRAYHAATMLNFGADAGKVLVTGGSYLYSKIQVLDTVEIFDPPSGAWALAGAMNCQRATHTATRLSSGAVLVTGSNTTQGKCAITGEIYQPTSGQQCTKNTDCFAGHCVDGICCETACQGSCLECVATSGKIGTASKCQFVAYGKPDTKATTPCAAPSFCDGKGFCFKTNGVACTKDSLCVSKFCVAGLCCDKLCDGPCVSCAIKGKEGTCSARPINTACSVSEPKACNGKGKCLLVNGQKCGADSDCISDICKDGFCCDRACDKICESCKLAGLQGYCAQLPAKTDLEGECIGKDAKCGGTCDGKNQCEFPGKGTSCGASPCMACDGTGECTTTPVDDSKCQVDCDKLDTPCRDYHDLVDNRCESLGLCKQPNDPKACTRYTELKCSDAGPDRGAVDLRPGPDLAPGPDAALHRGSAEKTGCDCGVGATHASGLGGSLMLALLLAMAYRRRNAAG